LLIDWGCTAEFMAAETTAVLTWLQIGDAAHALNSSASFVNGLEI